jgi:hypothetical protein
MNRAARKVDSGGITKVEINKTFVIQNLFPRPIKSSPAPEIFLNYSLDSELWGGGCGTRG